MRAADACPPGVPAPVSIATTTAIARPPPQDGYGLLPGVAGRLGLPGRVPGVAEVGQDGGLGVAVAELAEQTNLSFALLGNVRSMRAWGGSRRECEEASAVP
jgi:hypothetical protein